MPKKVIDILPNISRTSEVLLFKDYVCIEHFPYRSSELVGRDLSDILNIMGIEMPFNFNYVFLRDDTNHIHTTIKEHGAYVTIINNKILFPQHEQNSLHGD